MRLTFSDRAAYPGDENIERIAATGDVSALVAALQFLEEETRARHATHMAAKYADRPRYAISDDWGHYFSDSVPEFDTRWVFDRHRWNVTVLHVTHRSGTNWLRGRLDEIADINESLVDANADALDLGMDEFGVREADELPGWVDEAIDIKRRTFVEAPHDADRT